MTKFSIIVPVYNVEKYLKRCLDSIFKQTFEDYEVIIVNDGSSDNSDVIIKSYDDKRIKYFKQENKGLSAARNKGVKEACGEYILFLDSDDYLSPLLLENINSSLDNKPDIVRYQVREVYDDKSIDYNEEGFSNLSGEMAFAKIVNYHFVEMACCYVFRLKYFQKEKFKFKENSYHEDFGLIPLVIMKAKKVNAISYIGYNYYQRENSIMNSTDYKKTVKKVTDFYEHYHYLIKEIAKVNGDSSVFKSFISNSLIIKILELNNKDYKIYLKKLHQDGVFDNLLTNTMGRKLKKILLIVSPRLYYRKRR